MITYTKTLKYLFLGISLFVTNVTFSQTGTVEVNQSEEVTQLLELKKEIDAEETQFRIQVYNGSRGGAEKTKTDFRKSFSQWPLEMKFETPNYKIWVGKFKTRMEAERALVKIKRKFENAFIFKPKKKKKK